MLVGDTINIDTATLSAAAAIAATNIKVSSVTGFVAGQTITIETGANQETAVITTVGTSGSSGTGLTLTAGLTKAHVSGAWVVGPNQESQTVTAVGTPGVNTTLFAAAAIGATNVKVASVTGIAVGDTVLIDTSANQESGTVTAVGTQGRNTTLNAAAAIGATNVSVANPTGMSVGDTLLIDTIANQESVTITDVPTDASRSGITFAPALTKAHASGVAASDLGTGITLASALAKAHSSGVAFSDLGTGLTITPGLALAHVSGTAVTDPGTGVTFTPGLTSAHAFSAPVNNGGIGPSAMLVKIVVDHQDGSRETFVSDGTWKVTKNTAYTNVTNTSRNGDAGDYVERYDANQEIPGWDMVGFSDTAWSTPYINGPHPRPVSATQDRFTHLDGNVSGISYRTVHPVSVTNLADGTLVADFGTVIPAMPEIHFRNGIAGTALSMLTTYRLNNTTSALALAAGASNVKVASVAGFVVGDTITIDAPADQHGAGNPEVATITSVGTQNRSTTLSVATTAGATGIRVASTTGMTAGDTLLVDTGANLETGTIASIPSPAPASPNPNVLLAGPLSLAHNSGVAVQDPGTGIGFTPALTMAHATGVWVEGSRAGTSSSDTQGSNMAWYYTQKAGDQTAKAFTHWAWRYLQISAPGAGEPLTADDISAMIQHTDVPADRAATFVSDDAMLNTIFPMLQRSGLYVSQETGEDTPTREKGQFLGDSVDIAFANTQALGERNATKRMIREFIYSQSHVWKNTSSGYCPTAPCSYDSYGVLSTGRMNAVYPNGDNMRDIPDYTEAFPDMVMRYYQQSGDLATLQSAYQSMKNVANYIKANEPSSGAATGLVWLLTGGTGSYANGIIDWPSRLGYVFNNNAARTIHAESGVAAFRDVAAAAAILGNAGDVSTYSNYASDLKAQINAAQRIAGDSLYSDGLGINSTNLSVATLVGATNVKVNSVAPFTVGDSVAFDSGNPPLKEVRTVVAVGTSGASGGGIDLNAPLSVAHASNAAVATFEHDPAVPRVRHPRGWRGRRRHQHQGQQRQRLLHGAVHRQRRLGDRDRHRCCPRNPNHRLRRDRRLRRHRHHPCGSARGGAPDRDVRGDALPAGPDLCRLQRRGPPGQLPGHRRVPRRAAPQDRSHGLGHHCPGPGHPRPPGHPARLPHQRQPVRPGPGRRPGRHLRLGGLGHRHGLEQHVARLGCPRDHVHDRRPRRHPDHRPGRRHGHRRSAEDGAHLPPRHPVDAARDGDLRLVARPARHDPRRDHSRQPTRHRLASGGSGPRICRQAAPVIRSTSACRTVV